MKLFLFLFIFDFLGAPSSAFGWPLANAGEFCGSQEQEKLSSSGLYTHPLLIELVGLLGRSQACPSGPPSPFALVLALPMDYFLVLMGTP